MRPPVSLSVVVLVPVVPVVSVVSVVPVVAYGPVMLTSTVHTPIGPWSHIYIHLAFGILGKRRGEWIRIPYLS